MLRAINVAIMGIPDRDETSGRDETLAGLVTAVGTHVDMAARRLLASDSAERAQGYWGLQMACECALKALLHRKMGSFPKTHDLDELHRLAAPHLTNFPAELLGALPDASRMINYRYGVGSELPLEQVWALYRSTLRIVQSVLAATVVFRLGKASFKIARPPWKKKP